MAFVELAIDMGTSYTTIYQKGVGLVLREPSVVVCENPKDAKSVSAIGINAKKMIGKTPKDSVVVFPIFESAVVNLEVAIVMLTYFINKIMPVKLVRPKIRAAVNLPCGLSGSERKLFEQTIYASGVKEAFFVESPVLAGFGVGAMSSHYEPCMVVDIGGGTTDIGVMSLGGIITSCSIGIGGNNIDTGIIDHLAETESLKVGLLSTERVKIQSGSLYSNDTSTAMINGRDMITKDPRSIIITSKDLMAVMEFYYYKILDVTKSMLHSLKEEVSGVILDRGIYVCGGSSQIAGLDKAFEKYLRVNVHTIDDPAYASILGGGRLLGDMELLERFS